MVSFLVKAFMGRPKAIKHLTVSKSWPQAIESVKARVEPLLQKHGFSLLTTYNYHEIVESKGFPIERKVFIYKLCQSKAASVMLNNHPEFSLFMPCSLSLYEENGQTVASTMNMEPLLAGLKREQELFKLATELFGAFKLVIHELGEEIK